MDDIIRDIAAMQKRSEQRADEVCEATWPLPALTTKEAYEEVQKAVCSVVLSALWLRSNREEKLRTIAAETTNFGICPFEWVETEDRRQVAVLCEPGLGKTEAMQRRIDFLLSVDHDVRIAIAVPTHRLGEGWLRALISSMGSRSPASGAELTGGTRTAGPSEMNRRSWVRRCCSEFLSRSEIGQF